MLDELVLFHLVSLTVFTMLSVTFSVVKVGISIWRFGNWQPPKSVNLVLSLVPRRWEREGRERLVLASSPGLQLCGGKTWYRLHAHALDFPYTLL